MHIFEAWLIYLIVVAVVWIVLCAANAFGGMSMAAKLFIALLIGLIVVIVMWGSIAISCPDDGFWLCFLLLLSFLAPLLIGLWLLWRGGWECVKNLGCHEQVDRTYVCRGDDCYPVKSEIKSRDGKTTIYHQ